MNARSFKTVFSKRLGALVAVGEHATSQGKANGASGPGASGAGEGAVSALAGIGYVAALSASFAFVSLAWAAPATNALPTGGTVVQGAASMSQNASQLNIQQTTQRAAINWQSFNIGAAAIVKVAQPNAQAVLLNRVVGQSPSQIFGKLQANGHVILVNPNGVLFGKDGSVNAGGFTASTLNISDANFMAGNMVYERNGSTAGIVNEGTIITAPGGYVALLGATVSNEGSISTKGGSVVMGAGETIKVPVSGTGRIKLELTPAAINASVSNSGSIVTEGGQVYMQALALNRAAAQILQSGSIDTTGEKGGDVHVLADGGQIRVSGSIKANSTDGTAGGDIYIGRDKDTNVLAAVGDASGARLESKGGFVETSGKFLNVDGTRVVAKDWLLDPDNIDITGDATAATAGYSKIKASDIVANLNNGTSVTIATSPTAGTSTNQPAYVGTPAPAGDGNILVNAVISKTLGGEASLTLLADNGITVNQEIKSTSNKLNVTMKANGSASGASSQGLVINKSIDANGGAINLEGKTTNSAAAVTVGSTAVIQGASVTMVGNSTSGAAIKGTGKVNATAGGVSITGVGNTTGDYAITTNNTIDATGDIEIKTTSAALHGIAIREKVTSSGGKIDIFADVTLSGNGSAINGNFAIKAKNDVTITGKSNGYYTINGLGAIESTEGKVTIDGTSTNSSALRLTNAVKAKGDVLIKGVGGNDSGINTGATTTVTSTDGNIKFEGKTTGQGIGINFSGATTINAEKGTFEATAESAAQQGLVFSGTTAVNARTYTINAETKGGAAGIYQGSGTTSFTSTAGDSSIKGKSASGRGVFIQNGTLHFNANSGSTATFSSGKGEMRLGFGGGPTVNTNGNVTLGSDQSNFFSQADTNVNSGTLTIRGKSAGHGVAIQDGSSNSTDILLKDGSSLVIVGESTGSGSGIHLLPVGVANKIDMTGQNAGGQKGSITMTGVSAAGVGISTGSTPITSDGGNITLTGTSNGANGTGLSLGGVIRSGNDTSVGTVTLNGTANGTGSSVGINNSGSVQGGSVDMTGVARGTNNAIFSAGAITSTVAGISIKGTNTSTATNGGGGSTLQGKVTAVGNINLEGHSSNTHATAGNQGLVIQNTVESTGGDITVTGTTTAGGQHAVAITENKVNNIVLSNGSLKVADGKTIDINANTLLINAGSTVNAGTGTVNIKTTSAGNEILIGGTTANDGQSTTLGSQKLGIDNDELNRITAGNLVIGDTASNGKITVAGATTTAAATGNITLKTGGDIAINQKLEVKAAKTLTLSAGGAVTDDNTKGIIKASQLQLLGVNAAVTLDSKKHEVGTLAADVKSLEFKNGTVVSALTVGSVNTTTGITAKDGVIVTTETGNLNLNEAISNTSSGNVVVGAGVSKLATETSGGDVQTAPGKSISNTNGKTFVYSGSAANTGALGNLNNTLGTLKIDGTAAQNADTNAAFGTGAGITGSEAKAQAIFREKLSFVNGTLSNATLTKVYGDTSTKSPAVDSSAATALLVEAKGALRNDAANSGTNSTVTTGTVGSNNRIEVSKSAVADTLTSTLTGGQFSTSQFLKAQTGTYKFNGMTSTKYDVGTGIDVTVNVEKRALTGSITQGNTTYGDALAAGVVNLTNKVGSDVVSANGVTFTTTGKTSTSSNLKAGTHADVQSVTDLTGADKDNYTFANVKGDYKVDKRPLTIAPGSVATKTADGNTTAVVTPGTLSNLVGTETLGVAATGTFSDANPGNNKAVNAFYTLQNGANGGVVSNYVLNLGTPANPDTRMTGNILASVNPVTPIAPVNNNTGANSRVRTVSGFSGAGAATGVLDDTPVTESREVCSDVFPENCECQPSVIPSIEICFAPKSVAATKEEK